MKCMQVWFFLLLLCLGSSVGFAGKIHYWTDENGVRHFTNQGRPEGVEDVGKKPEVTRPAQPEPAQAEEQEQQVGPSREDIQPSEPTAEEQRRQAEQERLKKKTEQERSRLQAEIDRIDGLAVGVSFTRGMIDNMRRPYQEQLGMLNEYPEKYFEKKARGELEK